MSRLSRVVFRGRLQGSAPPRDRVTELASTRPLYIRDRDWVGGDGGGGSPPLPVARWWKTQPPPPPSTAAFGATLSSGTRFGGRFSRREQRDTPPHRDAMEMDGLDVVFHDFLRFYGCYDRVEICFNCSCEISFGGRGSFDDRVLYWKIMCSFRSLWFPVLSIKLFSNVLCCIHFFATLYQQ